MAGGADGGVERGFPHLQERFPGILPEPCALHDRRGGSQHVAARERRGEWPADRAGRRSGGRDGRVLHAPRGGWEVTGTGTRRTQGLRMGRVHGTAGRGVRRTDGPCMRPWEVQREGSGTHAGPGTRRLLLISLERRRTVTTGRAVPLTSRSGPVGPRKADGRGLRTHRGVSGRDDYRRAQNPCLWSE